MAGDYDILENEGTEQYSCISKIEIHEDYDSFTKENDVALLKLRKSFNDIKPIIFKKYTESLEGGED